MDQEFSERVLDNIMKNTKEWLKQFEQSKYYATLSESEKEDVEFAVELFTEWNYSYELRRPREWTQESLTRILLDLFVRKVGAEPSFFENVEPILTQYFLFLQEIGKIKNSKALIKKLTEDAPIMVELIEEEEEEDWGIGKQVMSMAASLDVDLDNEVELQQFIQLFNALKEKENNQ